MLVTFLVVVMSGQISTNNSVQVQPSKEICEAAKAIHLELPRDPTWGTHGVSKPVLVECITKEIPMELKP